MEQKEFFRHLFSSSKPLEYPLVWCYVLSLADDITTIRISSTKLMSVVNLDKTKLYRVLDYGCDLLGLEFYSRQNHIIFIKKPIEDEKIDVKTSIRLVNEIEHQPEDTTTRRVAKKAKGMEGQYKEAVIMVVDYLNKKAATAYRYDTPKTITLLTQLFKRSYNLTDVYAVVDFKCTEWLNTENCVYLRPETLFGNKFESYLQASRMLKRVHPVTPIKQAELFSAEKINEKLNEFDDNDFARN